MKTSSSIYIVCDDGPVDVSVGDHATTSRDFHVSVSLPGITLYGADRQTIAATLRQVLAAVESEQQRQLADLHAKYPESVGGAA